MKLKEIIKKTAGKNEWCVLSHDGSKSFGCYPTKGKAEKRLAQIEYFKSQEAAGQGQGVGGPKQGDGGINFCVCPSCGKTVGHEKGIPCIEKSCPSCGTKMIGKTKESIMTEAQIREMIAKMQEQIEMEGGIEKVLRAMLVDQYGMSKADAGKLVKAGFDKEAAMGVMEELDMADKLKADYLKLIGMWKSDVKMNTFSDLEFLMKESQVPFTLLEANAEGTVWKVCVIEQGKSYNKTVYTPKALKDMEKIINEADNDGKPIPCNAFKFEETLNHLPETARTFVKGFVENIVGWFKKAKVVGKKLIAELHLDEGAKKIISLLKTAKKKGIAMPFGLSIDGDGDVKDGFDNEPVKEVVGVGSLNSIDCVTFPSAGGKFLALVESICKEEAMYKLLLEMYGRIFPELLEGVDLSKVDLETAKKIIAEAVKKESRAKFDLTEDNVGEAVKFVADLESTIREEKAKAARAPEPKVTPKVEPKVEPKAEGGAEISEALKEAKEAMSAVKKLQEETEAERCKLLLSRVLDESALPDVFKDQIRDEFKEQVFTEEALLAKVNSMEKTVAAFNEGKSTVKVVTDERAKKLDFYQEEMDKLVGEHVVEGKLQPAGGGIWGLSIKKSYVDVTGDEDVSGQMVPGQRGRLHESIVTTDYPYLLANSMTKKMVREYEAGDPMYRKIANIVPLPDFKTQDRIAFGQFENLSTVLEDAAFPELANPSEERAQYAALTKGGFFGISRRSIINDDLREFSKMTRLLGRAALRTLNVFCFDQMLNVSGGVINAGTIYDSTALYTAAHGNITSDPLTWTALDAALTAMWEHKDIDDKLQLGMEPKYIVVPRQLKSTAQRIVNTEKFPGTNNIPVNDVNPVYQSVEILVSPYLRADINNWYLLADPMVWDGLELGFIQGKEQPTVISSNQETAESMFTNDRLRFKIRHEYGIGTLDFRPFYMGTPA